MKILIVEDEPLVALSLKNNLEKLDHKITSIENSYENALTAVDKETPDLVMIDIELKGQFSGIDLGRILSVMNVHHIYTTGNQDDVTFKEASKTKPLRNLPKPVTYLSLRNAFREIDFFKRPEELPVVVTFPGEAGYDVKVDLSTIFHVIAAGNNCDVYFRDSRKTLGIAMGKFLEQANLPTLVRVGKSVAINLEHFSKTRGNAAIMSNGVEIRITDLKQFNNYLKIFR